MKRLGTYITLFFLSGILLSEWISISFTACCAILSGACIGLGAAFPLRLKMPAKRFNFIFLFGACLVFLMLGVQRASLQKTDNQNVIFDKIERAASFIKSKMTRNISKILPGGDDQAVALALVLGDKSRLSSSLKASYKEAGVMHALALSGLHVGIVWSLVASLLYLLRLNRTTSKAELPLSLAIIFAYAVITGLSPSVLRACSMLAIYRLSRCGARSADKVSVLAFTAFLLSWFNPSSVLTIGFQLSFAATAGIVIVYPVINQGIKRLVKKIAGPTLLRKLLGGGLSIVGVSVACQIFTLPLTLLYFGQFPSYYLLSNLAVIPLVTLAVYAIAAALIAQPLPILGPASALLAARLLSLLNALVRYLN